MTHLQAVQIVALFMQRAFMSGIPYGALGTPNMQSIVEICAMSESDAISVVRAEPRFASIIADLKL
jgi:hypothetical protein